MYKVPEEWKLSDFLELSNDEKLKWLYNGVKNAEGGGGSSDAFEVKFTAVFDAQSGTYTVTSDKTYSEINAAYTANKKIYAWLSSANNPTLLTTGYLPVGVGSTFLFYFNDKNDPGYYARWQITVGTESITAFVSYESEPVYISGDYADGDTLDEASLEIFDTALGINQSLVYINIGVGDSYGTFIFSGLYGGYCFAGSPDAIGATAVIDDTTGEITVTAPNS